MKFWSRVDLAPLIDVHEHEAAFRKAIAQSNGRLVPLADPATYRRVRPPQDLRKAYGRASRTIHQLRGEGALLREELDARDEVISEDAEVIAELQAALDTTRPAPDPAVLGEQLKKVWFRPRPGFLNTESAWQEVAETAIDAVRGLRPQVVPGPPRAVPGPPRSRSEAAADDTPLAEWEIELLDAEADRRLGCTAFVPVAGDRWICTQTNGHEGHHEIYSEKDGRRVGIWHRAKPTPTNVAGGSEAADTPAAAPWAGEPPAPGDTLAEQAETHLEQLAQVIASADLDLTGGRWATTHDGLRAYYRGRADAVVLAGWRPPLVSLYQSDAVEAAAQVVRAHVALRRVDGIHCLCGWGAEPPRRLLTDHAHHVAEQLAGTGVLG